MDDKTKKELQDFIDRDFELAEKSIKEFEKETGIKANMKDRFCYFVCWDLQKQYGLDLKGVIPE